MPMELDLGPQAEQFRDEVRGWLEANRPDELSGIDEERAAFGNVPGIEAWTKKLQDAGFMCVSWPKEFGGRGFSRPEGARLNEGVAPARRPPGFPRRGGGAPGPAATACRGGRARG